ncbi:response regulator [Asticcacaulis taihuensis]|uniref:Response regulator receiver domain-containing protein n=1 Tax=Asticcacaulis taihuensis TaxID=260084 RepID=A0A1G4S290_9CAUL|nr:response regulator [Asticcacaulis taihuensis]SCW63138.1 Response regulator receiver domain-containing protein [Asticcacaulis taihuensis]
MANLLIREGRPAEIMLVEDNRGDALLAARAFRQAEIENNLTVAETGEKALAMLRREGEYAGLRLPDIILLDLNLPMMSGKDVLAEIKTDDVLRHIPVIILSSSSAPPDIAGSYGLHANAYIVKPFNLENFSDVVRSIEQFFFVLAVLPSPE